MTVSGDKKKKKQGKGLVNGEADTTQQDVGRARRRVLKSEEVGVHSRGAKIETLQITPNMTTGERGWPLSSALPREGSPTRRCKA